MERKLCRNYHKWLNHFISKAAISSSVISKHNSFRVLFDKIVSVYFIWKKNNMYIFWHWKWPAQGTSTVPVVSAHFRSLLSISLRLTQSITCGYSNDSNNPHRRCALVHNRIALYFSIDSGSAQSCPLPEYPSRDLKFPNPRLTLNGSLDPRVSSPLPQTTVRSVLLFLQDS